MKTIHANIFRTTAVLSILSSALIIPSRANTITLDWVSAGNNVAGYYYVSPYTAEIKSTGQLITLYCIDFNHEVAPPWEWDANITLLTPTALGTAQYGNQWTNYEAAAWLIDQLTLASDSYHQDVFQFAAWNIFLDSSHSSAFTNSENAMGGNFIGDVTTAYSNAFNSVSGGYTPQGWALVSPYPPGQPDSTQEFLTPDHGEFAPVATPEPLSIVLLGTACLGVAVFARRRAKRCTK